MGRSLLPLVACILLLSSVARSYGITPKPGAGKLPSPSLYQSPRFRWWWPGGWIEPDEVKKEITAIVDAGFGGMYLPVDSVFDATTKFD